MKDNNILIQIEADPLKIFKDWFELAKKKESHLVFPTQVDEHWLENPKEANLEGARLLYIVRIKV